MMSAADRGLFEVRRPQSADRRLPRVRARPRSSGRRRQRWIDLVSDLRILVFATHPETAAALIKDQDQQMADPVLRQIFLDFEHAHDLDPKDPALDGLADRMIEATRQRYPAGELPGQRTGSEIPALIQAAVNDSSPACVWTRSMVSRFAMGRGRLQARYCVARCQTPMTFPAGSRNVATLRLPAGYGGITMLPPVRSASRASTRRPPRRP